MILTFFVFFPPVWQARVLHYFVSIKVVMAIILDIILKRSNKLYHEGVSNNDYYEHSFKHNSLECRVVIVIVGYVFKFDRVIQDTLSGIICIESPTDVKHEGVLMTIEGTVDLQISTQNVGAFDAFYNSVKVYLLILFNRI